MNEKEMSLIVQDVQEDYERRKAERFSLEKSWQLNMNFVSGAQYCDVSPEGDIVEEDKRFYWQSRKVFNHIAPVVDTRMAKLLKMTPELHVAPASDEDKDLYVAKLAKAIIDGVSVNANLDETVRRATTWSEICGTAFYKILWNDAFGMEIGEGDGGKIYEGDVDIVPVSPFEIYPDNLAAENFDGVKSVIQAKAMSVDAIYENYGVAVKGRKIEDFSSLPYSESSVNKKNLFKGNGIEKEDYEIVIERYTKPTSKEKNGRVEIVAGDKLLYLGELPYENAKNKGRAFPFVMQKCIDMPGAFFGTSIVDRLIPLQRAYNAVRNRKHEFLNRLTMGVIAVEDGSVDTELLEEDGLCPGKILVYRQGSEIPKFMDIGSIPPEFDAEEKTLESEFLLIGETNEISRNSTNPTNVTSATGLKILLDQYNERLFISAKNIERALKEIGCQILRLYKQHVYGNRCVRFSGDGKNMQLHYFSASELQADDVIVTADDKSSPTTERAEIIELINLGLFSDENGRIKEENKNRILSALGFSSFETVKDLSALHENKAREENLKLLGEYVAPDEYDDHSLHISEHTRYLLSDEFKKYSEGEIKQRFITHLKEHKERSKEI